MLKNILMLLSVCVSLIGISTIIALRLSEKINRLNIQIQKKEHYEISY